MSRRLAVLALVTLIALAVPALRAGAAPGLVLPALYYQNGATVYAVNPDGSGRVAVATLPAGFTALPQPRLLPDGRLLYPTGVGFAAVDRDGVLSGIRTPDLAPGERVWSIIPSPDAHMLAWQIVAPSTVNGIPVNTGSGRIALTGRFGDSGTTAFSAQADGANDGQMPVLLGWRPSSPYGAGGPTLLLQDLYSANDPRAGILFNVRRGLIEYDPAIDDIVNDYLPPLRSAIPAQRALTVSGDGVWTVYGDATAFTPSGEGPLAQTLYLLNLNTNALVVLDTAARYPATAALVAVTRHREGKRVVTTRRVTGVLRQYQYFSHNAYVAPDDRHVLYTELTVSYPPGAQVPQVQHHALVATMDGRVRTVLAPDTEGVGWVNGTVAVVRRATGLYTINIGSHSVHTLARGVGAQLRFVGMRGVQAPAG